PYSVKGLIYVYTSFVIFPFFYTHPASTHIYTLSLHDALPISPVKNCFAVHDRRLGSLPSGDFRNAVRRFLWIEVLPRSGRDVRRSEEHTSELQSLAYLVCRLLLEKKNPQMTIYCIEYVCDTII